MDVLLARLRAFTLELQVTNHYDRKPGMFDPEEADIYKGCLVYLVVIAVSLAIWAGLWFWLT